MKTPAVSQAKLRPREALLEARALKPLALAIRGAGTCELRIPREKYDPFRLLGLIERHGGALIKCLPFKLMAKTILSSVLFQRRRTR